MSTYPTSGTLDQIAGRPLEDGSPTDRSVGRAPYVPPRTFGDLLKSTHLHGCAKCSFCKQGSPYSLTPGFAGARKYSTRHYACDACIGERLDVVLPAVKRHEKFQRDMAKLRGAG